MNLTRMRLSFSFLLVAITPLFAADTGNLLRNGNFQDDWLSQLAETKNHHWCYSSEFYNRRDFNPDGWTLTGSWQWLNAEAPYGQRHLILTGPNAAVQQRVNWLMVNDERKSENFPDAGGFPSEVTVTSACPDKLMRDLTFRVRVKGQDVPTNGVTLSVGWPREKASKTITNVPLPSGTYDAQWVEAKIPASVWFQTVTNGALPGFAQVSLQYKNPTGSVEIISAELTASAPATPNLLVNGGFETLDKKTGYPEGWSQPEKYRYFPPRHYYIFNTWHNAVFDNRGPVTVDSLVTHSGAHSLKMIVPAGDEKFVASQPIVLNQTEARLIEVSVWVRTDRLCMLQIDAVDQDGKRLDCFDFIHKMPVSIGTDGWRQLRQIFRPRTPVQSVRLQLCTRGVNGYTLDDTTTQPQNTVTGTIWWDEVRLFEPESTPAELAKRNVQLVPDRKPASPGPQIATLDLGERLLGANALSVTLTNAGKAQYGLQWEFTSPTGQHAVFKSKTLTVPYTLTEPCAKAYTEYHGTLTLLNEKEKPVGSNELWFATWTQPVDLQLGSLYLLPDQKEFVRLNFGLTQPVLQNVKAVRLEVRRRGTGAVLRTWEIPATPAALLAQRDKIPFDLRGDFGNLLLTDFDASFLPLQAFNNPERNWFVRATVLDNAGQTVASVDSPAFCRQAHEAPQPAIQSVKIKGNNLYVNDQPWMPWGAIYGFMPVYDGPADSGKSRDLHNVPGWSIYDRFGGNYSRSRNDFNCARQVATAVTPEKALWNSWTNDNLYCSSAFVTKNIAFTTNDFTAAYAEFCRTGPMVVATAVGVEEAFGFFHDITEEQRQGLGKVADKLRELTGKPVMMGHGGYWNRLEFERVIGYDIYDPETEPLYPGNLHTDLMPLLAGKDKVAWLRPQMYEDVPYERWRFHAFVELMRGCRGWQFAHGPGDQSLFRGLHGEMEFMKPIMYSAETGPAVQIEPAIEHVTRQHGGKLYIIAATTHGMAFGNWRANGTNRLTEARTLTYRDEANCYGLAEKIEHTAGVIGIQCVPDPRTWPAGTKLVQAVRLDPQAPPTSLAALVKTEGRWIHAATWGKVDFAAIRGDTDAAYWFLSTFYRHAKGFLAWDKHLVPQAIQYIPEKTADMGAVPAAGEWIKLEVPLDNVGAVGGLLDGVSFLHTGGRIEWGRTSIVAPDGTETVLWGDQIGQAPDQLAQAKVSVPGLKAGTKVRVLFEDRELKAEAGSFTDDFRGADLYERYGGGSTIGYGDTPVALHVYEVPQ